MTEKNIEINKKKSFFTLRSILRILALLCIAFVFCPSFLVSCSGQNMDISVMTVVGGATAYGEQIIEPYPIMLICLFIPIAIFLVLCIKKYSGKKIAGLVFLLVLVDFIVWIIFRIAVKQRAEENYCTFKTTGWYVVNIITLILMLIISLLAVLKKVQMTTDIVSVFTNGTKQDTLNKMSTVINQMSGVVSKMAENTIMIGANSKLEPTNVCVKCGSPILQGCKFCTKCGAPVSAAVSDVAEETTKKCHHCGANVEENASFCTACGTKVE